MTESTAERAPRDIPPGGAIVTAGASGIGLATVRAFAARGIPVAACDVDEKALAALAGPPAVNTTVCDVSDAEAVGRWVAGAAAALGGIRYVVSNAGIGGPTAPAEQIDLADWTRVLEVNLTGAFLVTRAAIPHLRAAGGGSVVVMSALAGRVGYPRRTPYAASKWGLIGYAKSLARELGPEGIRVNAVLPGGVAGPRLEAVFDGRAAATGVPRHEVVSSALRNQSVKEFTTAEDVADLVVYLCSESARRISGQAIAIDGDSQAAE